MRGRASSGELLSELRSWKGPERMGYSAKMNDLDGKVKS